MASMEDLANKDIAGNMQDEVSTTFIGNEMMVMEGISPYFGTLNVSASIISRQERPNDGLGQHMDDQDVYVDEMNVCMYRRALNKLQKSLMSDLDAESVCDHIIQDELMDMDQWESITSKETTRKRNTELIRFIHKGGHKTIDSFVCALEASGSHLFDSIQKKYVEISQPSRLSLANNQDIMDGNIQATVNVKAEIDCKSETEKNFDMLRDASKQFILDKYTSEDDIAVFQKKLLKTGATLQKITDGCIEFTLSFTNCYDLSNFYMNYVDGSFQKIVEENILTQKEKAYLKITQISLPMRLNKEKYIEALRILWSVDSGAPKVSKAAKIDATTQTVTTPTTPPAVEKDRPGDQYWKNFVPVDYKKHLTRAIATSLKRVAKEKLTSPGEKMIKISPIIATPQIKKKQSITPPPKMDFSLQKDDEEHKIPNSLDSGFGSLEDNILLSD